VKSSSDKAAKLVPFRPHWSGTGSGRLNCLEVHWSQESTSAALHCVGSAKAAIKASATPKNANKCIQINIYFHATRKIKAGGNRLERYSDFSCLSREMVKNRMEC
jgi:hypothetical protein